MACVGGIVYIGARAAGGQRGARRETEAGDRSARTRAARSCLLFHVTRPPCSTEIGVVSSLSKKSQIYIFPGHERTSQRREFPYMNHISYVHITVIGVYVSDVLHANQAPAPL